MQSFGCWRSPTVFLTLLAGLMGPRQSNGGGVGSQRDDPAVATTTIEIRDGLVVSGLNRNHRTIISTDPINAEVVRGIWTGPRAGDPVTTAAGQVRHWELIKAAANGSFPRLAPNSYVASTITSPKQIVMVLKASGHTMLYVNGEPRIGDIYNTNYVYIPVLLRKGPNSFLFQAGGAISNAGSRLPELPHSLTRQI